MITKMVGLELCYTATHVLVSVVSLKNLAHVLHPMICVRCPPLVNYLNEPLRLKQCPVKHRKAVNMEAGILRKYESNSTSWVRKSFPTWHLRSSAAGSLGETITLVPWPQLALEQDAQLSVHLPNQWSPGNFGALHWLQQ